MAPRFFPSITRYAGHPLRVFTACLKTVFFVHVIMKYGFVVGPTRGASMLPEFEVIGDWALISRGYRRGKDIVVGDMIQFDSVVEPGEKVIKRVLGLEGDYVLRGTPGEGNGSMIQIPEGHCWVIGDNLPHSRDSRHFGPMPMALIKGKVIAKVLPWTDRRWIENKLQPVDKLE